MAVATDTVEPPSPPQRRNGAGTAALVIGVNALGLAALVIFFPIAFIVGIIAAIFGMIGMGRAKRGEADNRSHAVAGLVTGLIAIVLAVVIGVRIGTFLNDHQGDFRRFWSCITSAPTEPEQDNCGRELGRALD
jgi:NADH:ubiquinone oxidoreductase subunit 6 (subunit J)